MADHTLKDKTILITGGAGFIGSNLIHFFLNTQSDCRIINLDKLTYAGNFDNLRDIENDPITVNITKTGSKIRSITAAS